MKLVIALAFTVSALAATTGCKGEEFSATVNCKVVEGGSVDCSIAQTQGKSEIEVCWEFKVACDSGATLEAPKTCARVKDGQTSSATIAAEKLTITGTCDKVKDAEVKNIAWSAK